MIESYIEPGNQKVGDGVYGKSSQTHASDGLNLKSFYTILQTLFKNIFIMSGLM